MLRIGIIGAGWHSREHHLPALARYRDQHPGTVEIAAICDVDVARAEGEAARYGTARGYASVDDMLARERLDAAMLITPPAATLRLMRRLLAARVPLLIEKPPGVTVEDARRVAELAEASGVGVMVSVNRRFDPVIAAGNAWLATRNVQHIRATFLRHARTEADFFTATAIHATDTIRYLAGDRGITSVAVSAPAAGSWRIAMVTFSGGCHAVLEILPTAGANAETYEAFGQGFRVVMRSAQDEGQLLCCENGQLVRSVAADLSEPTYVRNGTYAETQAFISAVAGRTPFAPVPRQIVPSLELAYAISQVAGFPPIPQPTSPEGG